MREEVGGGECMGREVEKSWSGVMGWLCEDTWKTGNSHPAGGRQRGWELPQGLWGVQGSTQTLLTSPTSPGM